MLSSWRSVISSRIFSRIFCLKPVLHGLLWLLTSSGAFWNYKNKVSPAASRILDDIIKHKQFYTYGKQYSADDIYKWIIWNDFKSNKDCPFYFVQVTPKTGHLLRSNIISKKDRFLFCSFGRRCFDNHWISKRNIEEWYKLELWAIPVCYRHFIS